MSNNTLKKEPLKLFNLPWYLFGIFAVVVLVATYMGVLPKGMAGCFALMIVLGTVLNIVGDNMPIVKDYLGGGAIVVIFGCSALNYFHVIPEAVVENITSFFKPTGAFLDFYIAALITDEELNEEYIIPKAFDPRVGPTVAKAVAEAARATGVARI